MNRDRLASIRQKTPTEMNLSTGQVFESDTNWLVSQLEEAWKKIEDLEKTVGTSEKEFGALERALEKQIRVAMDNPMLEVSHKDTVHQLLGIARKALSEHGGT